MIATKNIIKESYTSYTNNLIASTLMPKLILLLVILAYFIFSDLYIRNSINAFYTRIIPLSLTLLLLIGILLKRYNDAFIAKLYYLLLTSLPLMMYGKCIVHLDDGLASSVSGTILVIFTISLDIKNQSKYASLIYAIPTLLFLFIIFSYFDLEKEQILTISNIFPIVFIGFIINRMQEKLRFQSFEKNYLFEKEKERTEMLYNKTLVQNNELIQQKNAIEKQTEELKKHKVELQNLNDTKDRFFSIIAHDLRNPFSSILNGTKLLSENCKTYSEKQINELSKLINKSANQGFNLLNNLLHWSMVQTNEIQFNPEQIEINELLDSIIALNSATLKDKGIIIKDEVPSNFKLIADKFMMETTLRNLIGNALKYTQKGGSITVNANKIKSQCYISILDTGIGIPTNKINRLFKISEQISTIGTANENGTGLGLILCKEFVEKHQGSINVLSNPGKGSCFSITIPQKNA